jgi:hypothetical protein
VAGSYKAHAAKSEENRMTMIFEAMEDSNEDQFPEIF